MGSLGRRIEALERLYATPAAQEERYKLTEEKRAAVSARLRRVIEAEERKGMPAPSEEELAQAVEGLKWALQERANRAA